MRPRDASPSAIQPRLSALFMRRARHVLRNREHGAPRMYHDIIRHGRVADKHRRRTTRHNPPRIRPRECLRYSQHARRVPRGPDFPRSRNTFEPPQSQSTRDDAGFGGEHSSRVPRTHRITPGDDLNTAHSLQNPPELWKNQSRIGRDREPDRITIPRVARRAAATTDPRLASRYRDRNTRLLSVRST